MRNDWYYIGIIWGTGSLNSDNFLIRHNSEHVMTQILHYVNSVYSAPQYTLVKINATEKTYFQTKVHLFNPKIYFIRHELGFTGRQNSNRNIPNILPNEHIHDFLIGYSQVGHWSYEPKRLRFYSHEPILMLYNSYINEEFGRKIMKLQNHKQSDVMRILYYQGNGVSDIAKHFEIATE